MNIKQTKEVSDKVIKYCSHFQGFLLLSGKNGTCKTTAARNCYHRLSPFRLPQRDDDIAIFINQSDLNIEWSRDISLQFYLLERLKNTRLLVLDDLGTRHPSDAFGDFLYALMDYRWREKAHKGTIITTNLNSSTMREKFGDAFFSRVASGVSLIFLGEDSRFDDLQAHFKAPCRQYQLKDNIR